MRIVLFSLIFLICLTSKSQSIPFDKYVTDTFRLTDFTAKKIVAYEINSVTVYVNYEDYKNELYTFWKNYKKSRKYKSSSNILNHDFENRYRVIDSVYKLLVKQIKIVDTIFLTQKSFSSVGLRCLMDLDRQIENRTCAIVDSNNVRQFIIIRKKGSWYRGPLESWGGRRYFLVDYKNYFYEATDWIS